MFKNVLLVISFIIYSHINFFLTQFSLIQYLINLLSTCDESVVQIYKCMIYGCSPFELITIKILHIDFNMFNNGKWGYFLMY